MKTLIIFLGKSGSGKDTQIKKLAKEFGYGMINGGDSVRELAKTNKKVARLLQKGEFVDNTIAYDIFSKNYNLVGHSDVILANGFPRVPEQVHWLNKFLNEKEAKIGAVFLLDISDEEAVRRLEKRARNDDIRRAIQRRISLYNEITTQVVNYYQKNRLLVKINAEKEADTVYQEISENLQWLLK